MTVLPPAECASDPSDPWWMRRANWIYESIVSGALVDHDDAEPATFAVSVEEIGRLSLPEGQFAAVDPYVMGGGPTAFEQTFPVEAADVFAVRARITSDRNSVAALILKGGIDAITSWSMATLPGQDVATLTGEEFFGYGVDAGKGSFGSVDALRVADRVLAADDGMLEDPISLAVFADDVGTESAVCVAPEDGAEPVAACSSGWGDGMYPTWLGISSSGEVVVAITDFLLVGDPYQSTDERSPNSATDEAARSGRKPLLRRLFGR